MASHRRERITTPGGTGVRNPALATAALGSVALLGQSADAASTAEVKPSREEVQERIDNLYNRVETESERTNSTRQRSVVERRRGGAGPLDAVSRRGQNGGAARGDSSFAASPYGTGVPSPRKGSAPARPPADGAALMSLVAGRQAEAIADAPAVPEAEESPRALEAGPRALEGPKALELEAPKSSRALDVLKGIEAVTGPPSDLQAKKTSTQQKLRQARELLSKATGGAAGTRTGGMKALEAGPAAQAMTVPAPTAQAMTVPAPTAQAPTVQAQPWPQPQAQRQGAPQMQAAAQMQPPAALEAAPSAQPWAQPQEPAQQQTGSWPVLGGDLQQPSGVTYGGGMPSGFPTDTLVGLPLDAGAGLPTATGTGLPTATGNGLPASGTGMPAGTATGRGMGLPVGADGTLATPGYGMANDLQSGFPTDTLTGLPLDAGAGLPTTTGTGLPAGVGLPVDTGTYAGSATNGAGFVMGPGAGFTADSLMGQQSGSAAGFPAGTETGYQAGTFGTAAGYPANTFGTAPGTTTGQSAKAAKAVAFAESQTGKPCVWGASGPGSYDGPGLVQAAWRAAGVMLPRTTWDQVRSGTTLVSVADALPGDLIFYYDDVSHVGIYTGDGKVIHAANPGSYVSEDSIYSMPIHSVVRPG